MDDTYKVKSYIVKQKDINSRMKSRSGGIFAAVSDCILAAGGVVYGCALDEDFVAVHKRATTSEERDEFRGSKYVQSDMKNVLKLALEDLKEGRLVLFSGTPCQIAGVRAICPNDRQENLLCMDIVCHGVPSPKVWEAYKSYMEGKYHGRITEVNFRNKRRHGWWDHVETVKIHGIEIDSQIFKNLFYEHNVLRDCCYECPYKNLKRQGDISIADAWGIAKANPEFDDNYGVSLVLVNTKKGEKWFEQAAESCFYEACDIADYMQEPFRHSFERPENYEQFWHRFWNIEFGDIVKEGYKDSLKQKTYWRVKRVVKALVPQKMINRIRGRK